MGISNVLRNNGDDDRESTCHKQDQSQSASSLKLNFQFIGGPTVLHWEGHNSFIRNEFEVHEHLMESLLDKISNRSSMTSRSRRQGLQISMTSCHCFCRELQLVFHPWDSDPSWSTPQGDEEHILDILLFGHILRRPSKASKPSQRSSPTRVRVCPGLQY
jgi:hypothetical protein